MNILDIISDSPKIYIFQKSSNKTNLGGIITLVYFIILVLISIAYIYDFYHVNYFQFNYFFKNIKKEDREKLKTENKDFNPNLTFTIEISNRNNILSNDKFVLYESGHILDGYELKKNVDELSFGLFYKCETDECNDLDKEFIFNMNYDSKILDHENSSSPISDTKSNFEYTFSLNQSKKIEAFWGVYGYEEEKGIFSKIYDNIINKVNKFTFGAIDNYQIYSLNSISYDRCGKTYCVEIIKFQMYNELKGIHQYKRKSKSIFDYLANIAALGTTIFNAICKFFGFLYSKNFDNYKIIDDILNKRTKKKILN